MTTNILHYRSCPRPLGLAECYRIKNFVDCMFEPVGSEDGIGLPLWDGTFHFAGEAGGFGFPAGVGFWTVGPGFQICNRRIYEHSSIAFSPSSFYSGNRWNVTLSNPGYLWWRGVALGQCDPDTAGHYDKHLTTPLPNYPLFIELEECP